MAVDLGEVREDDPAATHWGWIETGKGAPCMIRKSAIGFRAQFTYGPEAEQERGKGRVVRLAARKAEGEQ